MALSSAAARRGEARRVTPVSAVQRARLMSAAIANVETHGLRKLTVARIVTDARVSRKAFYELFTDAEDCLGAAIAQTLAEAERQAREAYKRGRGWREGMRAAVASLLGFAEAHRGLARICLIDTLAGGPTLAQLRSGAIERAARAIAEGARTRGGRAQPPLIALAVAGGAAELAQSRLGAGERAPLGELSATIMSVIVMPYLGAAAAREELRTPLAAATVPRGRPDPLPAFQIRLTYRTLRVLGAIAAQPGASNRRVAEAAGIGDDAQVSKLLKRLAERGLIENTLPAPRGKPNAWRLTRLGASLHRAARP